MTKRTLEPTLLLALGVSVFWVVMAGWSDGLGRLGIATYGMVFLDSYAVMAALDAMRAGLDPHAANALDPLLRYHVYSDWWLALKWTGLGRAQNFIVGIAWVTAFGFAAWSTARPRTWREALWLTVILISPPVLLAVVRGNNDLVIFVLLALCGVALAGNGGGKLRWLLALVGIGLATGLKYYPAVAVIMFLWIRPVRLIPMRLGCAVLVAGLALASVWPDLRRVPANVQGGIHTMGAAVWWRDLGWTDAQAAVPGLLLLAVVGTGFALSRFTAGLAARGEVRERLLAALSAVTMLACFVSTVNFAYRWIFVVWIALWAWRRAGENLPSRERWAARSACGLIFICVWADGILCVVVNGLSPKSPDWIEHLLLTYRAWTQPLYWLLMAMFAGWLLEGVLSTVREWRQQRSSA